MLLEGSQGGDVTAIVAFSSKKAFDTWYESDEYQEILDDRLDSTFRHLVTGCQL